MYESWGCRVDKVIYPPLDCASFKPTTPNPSADYVLAYAGKETKFSILKELTALGLKFKVFGSKAPVPKRLLKDSNVEFLGKITDEELVRLYSNALFTLSVFTHEPFGYIPVESMACGTPVLTYGKQGPGESVLEKETGWFAYDDPQLVSFAARLWKDGYPSRMRDNCRNRALEFDAGKIAKDWLGLLERSADFEV
jgi:glycosyltransferase involved in cell wall biosynthesis